MIPDFQTIMLPFLEIMADKKERSIREITLMISDKFGLSDEERRQLLASGNQEIINNRVGWARVYLKKAKLIDKIRRGVFVITEQGIKVLASKPERIDIKFLKSFPDFNEWQASYKSSKNTIEPDNDIEVEKTPEELLDYSFTKLKDELAIELIDKIKSCSPGFFERLVVDLLIKMGYGGSRKEAGQIIGKSGDGGIDGIIKEDKLGLDTIYIQAKRWENTVPVGQIRDFAGSLLSKKARKGIFITTSNFPKNAYEFVSNIEHKIVLIDGKELAELMIENNVGLTTKINYEIKKIDSDYFEE
jgi:restriction system protein